MDRLKTFGIWLLIIIAFFLFSNGIIYIYMHADEIRDTNFFLKKYKSSENVIDINEKNIYNN